MVIQELVFRFLFPLPELKHFNRSNYTPKTPNIERIPSMRYEQRTFQSYPDTAFSFVHFLNGYGFRDKHDWPKAKGSDRLRLMFVGDSFLEGAMAATGHTITDYFKGQDVQNKYETMNMGIIGAGLPEYTKLIHDAVPLFSPDVVFLTLFSNDISNRQVQRPTGTVDDEEFNAWTPRLVELVHLLSINDPVPFRWKGAASFMPATPDPFNLWTTRESDFAPHVMPEMAEYMKQGNMNTFRINNAIAEQKNLSKEIDLGPFLQWVKAFLAEHKSKLVVTYIPSRLQLNNWYYQYELATCQVLCPDTMDLTGSAYQIHSAQLYESCKKLDVPFFDMTPVVLNEESTGNHLYWNYDDHMRSKGYKLIGETLFKQWSEQQDSNYSLK